MTVLAERITWHIAPSRVMTAVTPAIPIDITTCTIRTIVLVGNMLITFAAHVCNVANSVAIVASNLDMRVLGDV